MTFALILENPQYLKITLVDKLGKEIGVIDEGEFSNTVNFEYSMKNLSPGIYFIRVNNNAHKFIYIGK